MDGWDWISPGGVKCRAPYGANNENLLLTSLHKIQPQFQGGKVASFFSFSKLSNYDVVIDRKPPTANCHLDFFAKLCAKTIGLVTISQSFKVKCLNNN